MIFYVADVDALYERALAAGCQPTTAPRHLYDYAPAGSNSPIQKLVAIVGIGANGDFVNKNQNTVLRFLSVVWRTIDAVKKDPSLFKLQAPYLKRRRHQP